MQIHICTNCTVREYAITSKSVLLDICIQISNVTALEKLLYSSFNTAPQGYTAPASQKTITLGVPHLAVIQPSVEQGWANSSNNQTSRVLYSDTCSKWGQQQGVGMSCKVTEERHIFVCSNLPTCDNVTHDEANYYVRTACRVCCIQALALQYAKS